MPLQVNTLVSAETAGDLPAIYELLKPFGVARWSLFFLISVGRGKVLQPLSPEDAENADGVGLRELEPGALHRRHNGGAFLPARRAEAMRAEGMTGEQIKRSRAARGFGIRDGHGIVFVSHTGDICPAGFLPLAVGNVRKDRLVDMYRNAPLFRSLHDPSQFGAGAACANTTPCAAALARGPSRPRETRSHPTPLHPRTASGGDALEPLNWVYGFSSRGGGLISIRQFSVALGSADPSADFPLKVGRSGRSGSSNVPRRLSEAIRTPGPDCRGPSG